MNSKALTLVELMIAIGISSILGATVVFMLRTSMDAYLFTETEALVQKILNETLSELSGESFNAYGIKDSLEIVGAAEDSFSFIPLWVDDSHSPPGGKKTFILNRPFKPGAAFPIAETVDSKRAHKNIFVTFLPNPEPSAGNLLNDTIILQEAVDPGASLRFLFHPDPAYFPDAVMTIRWDPKQNCFLRAYKGKTEKIPREVYKGLKLTDARFQYFDNTNTEIPKPVPADFILSISAVKLSLGLSRGKEKLKEASVFINLRNSRVFGKGIIIRQGTRVRMPDSRNIRAFNLVNVAGVKEGDVIQLRAEPKNGSSWRICLDLGLKENTPVIERYSIEYPSGTAVYSKDVNQALDMPFDLLNLGSDRYDYDFDKDRDNAVGLEGEVTLLVEKMTCQGASVSIRP